MLKTPRYCALVAICIAGCAQHTRSSATAPSASLAPQPATRQSPAASAAQLGILPLPPAGFTPKPLEQDETSTQQVWVSSSKATAYGIVRFSLPLPVGPGFALPGFIAETAKKQGPTKLLASKAHPRSGGVEFTADLPLYHMRGILWTKGFTGWVVYASTDRSMPVDADDLAAALAARDATVPTNP